MPAPRLSRHLRPCRAVWARFASDGPATRWRRVVLERAGKADEKKADEKKADEAKAGEAKAGEKKAGKKAGEAKADENKAGEVKKAETPAAQEEGLRQRLRELEEELAGLQAKLARAASGRGTGTGTGTATATATGTKKPGERAASLLNELFPQPAAEAPSDRRRPQPPKLDLPAPVARITRQPVDTRSPRQRSAEALSVRSEQTTVLQLSHASTALTEPDFRRLVPRGRHIDSWAAADAAYARIIPGRDPVSLARLPFYYLLFRTPAAALAYQKNAARLSRLAALHQPDGFASALPPPTGFLEDGEDLAAVAASFVLHPAAPGRRLDLRVVMQPYNPALRALITAGGYAPIVPAADDRGRRIHRVLLHIDGYEPGHWDLWHIIARHAHAKGIIWPFRNDHPSALRRLRDAINLSTVSRHKFQATASSNPRAAQFESTVDYQDPNIASFLGHGDAKEVNQLVMNRLYNRWLVEFDDEDAARRFATLWHRVLLPEAKDNKGAWREAEEDRWVEAEYLW